VQFEEVLIDDYTTENTLVVSEQSHIGSACELVLGFSSYLEVVVCRVTRLCNTYSKPEGEPAAHQAKVGLLSRVSIHIAMRSKYNEGRS